MLKTLSKGKNIKIEKTIDANMYDSLSLFQYPYLNNNIPEANTLLLYHNSLKFNGSNCFY